MTNEKKAQEISEDFYMPDTGFNREDLYESAMEMAEWKDKQFSIERKQLIEKANQSVTQSFENGANFKKHEIDAKEMDLEKEFNNYAKNILACDVQFEPFTQLYNCAKHFFELGLKA